MDVCVRRKTLYQDIAYSTVCTCLSVLPLSIDAIGLEYNNADHATTKFPPCWLMYGKHPVYNWEDIVIVKSPRFQDHVKDRQIALNRITGRAEQLSVAVTNSNYVLEQTVLVQLCSTAAEALNREWASCAKIIGLCAKPEYVRVKYLNTNFSRPEGREEEVPVRLLYPLADDVDLQASIAAGEIVSRPHAALNTRDTRVYVDKIIMVRMLKYGKHKADETSYLVLFSGNTLLQASWVLHEHLDMKQLSHVEQLVCNDYFFFLSHYTVPGLSSQSCYSSSQGQQTR